MAGSASHPRGGRTTRAGETDRSTPRNEENGGRRWGLLTYLSLTLTVTPAVAQAGEAGREGPMQQAQRLLQADRQADAYGSNGTASVEGCVNVCVYI
jgi:hypothetical protein